MSLLTRLHATEARQNQEAPGVQTAKTSGTKENIDPRVKMMKEIQAMLDGYTTYPADSTGAHVDDQHDNLSRKLKRKWHP